MGLLFPPVPELGVLTVGLLAAQLINVAINKIAINCFIKLEQETHSSRRVV